MNSNEQKQMMYAAIWVAAILLAIVIWMLLHDPNTIVKEGGDVVIELG